MNARSNLLSLLARCALFAGLLAAARAMMNCGNNTVTAPPNGMGTVNVSISDPPSCAAPSGDFDSVFITIRSVQAHISATADDNSSGWQELAPQLATQSNRALSIPLFPGSTSEIAVTSSATCPAGSPAGAFCADYSLVVPASNLSVGTFSAGTTSFAPPASGDILYSVEASAFRPLSNGSTICSPPTQSTNQDSASQPLKVTAGASVRAKRLDFSGCS
jgi:hypothetical protein